MNEQELRNAWRRAFEGAGDDPPAALENRLTQAFRMEHRRRRGRRRVWLWSSAAAVAAAVLLAAIWFGHSFETVVSSVPLAHVRGSESAAAPQVVTVAPRPVRHLRARRAHRRPASQPEAPPTEFAGGFVPLTDDPQPVSSGEVIRVEMPAGALSGLGFTVAASRATMPVRADVLLDEVGTARAIRLVSAGTSFR